MWYGLRIGSGGGAGGRGDVGVVGRLVPIIGGGGTRCVIGVPRGGETRPVTTVICGTWFVLALEDIEVFRGTIGIIGTIEDDGLPVGSPSYEAEGRPAKFGRCPGCDDDRLRV